MITPAVPTPYPDVNIVLQLLVSNLEAILGPQFTGMYLYGSLATGDFDPAHSDIDFLVVTTTQLPDQLLASLEALHTYIAASGIPWTTKLEGSYIPQDALRRYDPANALHPAIRLGEPFHLEQHDTDWVIQRSIIRTNGVVVAGPPPETLIDPITRMELHGAVLDFIRHEWWRAMLIDPTPLTRPGYQAYTILTMCRILYTLAHGTIVSKRAAAAWTAQELGEPWAALIERAVNLRSAPDFGRLAETQDFIRHTLECCKRFEEPPPEI